MSIHFPCKVYYRHLAHKHLIPYPLDLNTSSWINIQNLLLALFDHLSMWWYLTGGAQMHALFFYVTLEVRTIVTWNADSAAFHVPDRSYPNAVRSRSGSLGIAFRIVIFGVPKHQQSPYRSLLVRRTKTNRYSVPKWIGTAYLNELVQKTNF